MALTISREQRDAIYELVVTHLTGIGDVWITLENRDIATSTRLARAFVEDLHVLNDLGWDETIDSERVTLADRIRGAGTVGIQSVRLRLVSDDGLSPAPDPLGEARAGHPAASR